MLFIYKGLNHEAAELSGEVESTDYDSAIKELQSRGIVVTSLSQKDGVKGSNPLKGFKFEMPAILGGGIKPKDIVIFSRQIATLFEAGVSALKAFLLLSAENENKTLARVLISVSDDIQSGLSLSKSMAKQPKLFTQFYISMVEAGEESGKLNQAFLYLADYLDRDYELREKIKKALTYPKLVMGVFGVILYAMFTFVVPKLAGLFAENDATLPVVTRVILSISNVLKDNMAIMVPLFIGMFVGISWYLGTPAGKRQSDILKTRLPAINKLTQRIFLARFSDNMNTMLSSGVPILRSLEITSNTVDNYVYKELLERVAMKVQNGKALSDALADEKGTVPNILVQMTKIGEETGQLGYILKNLATFYKREVDIAIEGVIGLIEPIMIVGMGLMVGVLVVGILLPIFSLAQSF